MTKLKSTFEGLRCAGDMTADELKVVPGSRVKVNYPGHETHGWEGMAGDFRKGGGLLKADGFWVHLDDDYTNDNGDPSHRKPYAMKRLYLLP